MLNHLPKLIGAVITIYGEVKTAVSKGSDGGKKITAPEWAAIVGSACAVLTGTLTGLFGDKLSAEAAEALLD